MADYTNYDYEALVERITELYKTKPGIGQGFDSSTGQMLIQLLADTTDHLFYMLERRSQEVFLDTARLDSSIITHASELGYRPRRKVSATGTLTLTLVDSDGVPVVAEGNVDIPKGTSVTFGDGVELVVVEDYTISAGNSTIDILVKEGILQSIDISANSTEFQESLDYTIADYNDIEEFSLEVQASNGDYIDVGDETNISRNLTSLSFASATDRVFDIRFSPDGMRIIFGDGEFGKTPEGTIIISYVNSSGSDVNIVKTGLSFSLPTQILRDDLNVTPLNEYRYTLTNTTPIRGGSDGETPQDIVRNAPSYIRTNNRAITAFDHEFWVLRSGIGGIIDAKAYGEQESDSLVFNMNNVIITYMTNDLLPLTPQQIADVQLYMENFKILTTHIGLREANYIKVFLTINYRMKASVPLSTSSMFAFIKTLLDDYFSYDRGSIGKSFQRSDLMTEIQRMSISSDGVQYDPTDYLDLDVEGEYEYIDGNRYFELYVWLDPLYTPTDGDVWTLVIEDIPITVTATAGDTSDDLLVKMRDELQNSNLILTAIYQEVGEPDKIRMKSRFFDGVFTMDLEPTDDVNTFVRDSTVLAVPIPLSRDEGVRFLAGSVYMLDGNDDIIFQDNGAGLMEDPNAINPSFAVNYVDGTFESPNLPAGSTRIRFQQSSVQNIYPGESGVVIFDSPVENDNVFPNTVITIN